MVWQCVYLFGARCCWAVVKPVVLDVWGYLEPLGNAFVFHIVVQESEKVSSVRSFTCRGILLPSAGQSGQMRFLPVQRGTGAVSAWWVSEVRG